MWIYTVTKFLKAQRSVKIWKQLLANYQYTRFWRRIVSGMKNGSIFIMLKEISGFVPTRSQNLLSNKVFWIGHVRLVDFWERVTLRGGHSVDVGHYAQQQREYDTLNAWYLAFVNKRHKLQQTKKVSKKTMPMLPSTNLSGWKYCPMSWADTI